MGTVQMLAFEDAGIGPIEYFQTDRTSDLIIQRIAKVAAKISVNAIRLILKAPVAAMAPVTNSDGIAGQKRRHDQACFAEYDQK